MNKLNTSLPKLLNILKIIESHFKSEKASVLLVDKIFKKKTDNKSSNKKKKMNPKASISKKRQRVSLPKVPVFVAKRMGAERETVSTILQV